MKLKLKHVLLISLLSAGALPLLAWAPNSRLAQGNWVKISVDKTGIYKLSFSYLREAGVINGNVPSSQLTVWGYPGGLLRQVVDNNRFDDINEIAIQVVDGGDGTFQDGDYILFYGEAPLQWEYNPADRFYNYRKSPYTDVSCYFLSSEIAATKRISDQASLPGTPGYSNNATDAMVVLDDDKVNLIKSGRVWLGEDIAPSGVQNANFNFPAALLGDSGRIRSEIAVRDFSGASYSLKMNGNSIISNETCPVVFDVYAATYAQPSRKVLYFNPAGGNNLNFQYSYTKSSSVSSAWLNYLEVNVRIPAVYNGKFQVYQDKNSLGNAIAAMSISSLGTTELWDVTNPAEIKRQQHSGGTFQYDASGTVIRRFVPVSDFQTPVSYTKVANQNLHALGSADMLILTVPSLKPQAERLANFHRDWDGMTVHVVMVADIYNEFSSGVQNVAGIRDFVRMFYERFGPEKMRYLLLFGDASYDYKGLMATNTNIVPTFQSANYYDPPTSYATDDFYGAVKPGQGADNTIDADSTFIGVGRIPVKDLEEARGVVDKIIMYVNPASFGDWRNRIVMIADDQDQTSGVGGWFMDDAEGCVNVITPNYPQYNIDKIYCDALPQKTTPQGARYPDANRIINEAFNKGALIVQYIGHGGEAGLAHEEIMTISDINSWTNSKAYPLVVTATCEFGRFDDPMRASAGELILLNQQKGGIALLTTTRPVFSGSNQALCLNFFDNNVLTPVNGKMPTLGDAIRRCKNAVRVVNTRNFCLLGDPALRLAYPELKVVTTTINGQPVDGTKNDTLKALTLVEIEGEIRNGAGNIESGFNGVVIPALLDKPSTINTLINDPWNTPRNFALQKSFIFKGRVTVTNGKFKFQFIVPKDISYADGLGKLSYYAYSDSHDAAGSNGNIAVVGNNNVSITDTKGPEIKLWMENRDFKPNDYVGSNSLLIADLSDESGINTTGMGVGREITATVPGEPEQVYVMNDYYQSDLNDFRKGSLSYPINGLTPGFHMIVVKAWDVFNNSSYALVSCRVARDNEILIFDLMNFPNPFWEKTQFSVSHNKSGADIKMTIDIINTQGQIVYTQEKEVLSSAATVQDFYWDGNNVSGAPVQAGVYLYRVRIEDGNGNFAEKTSRLLFGN